MSDVTLLDPAHHAPTVLDELVAEEDAARAFAALGALSRRQGLCMWLYYVEGVPTERIAELLKEQLETLTDEEAAVGTDRLPVAVPTDRFGGTYNSAPRRQSRDSDDFFDYLLRGSFRVPDCERAPDESLRFDMGSDSNNAH